MAPIPQAIAQPTVDAIYRAYEAREAATLRRGHLGASIIGRKCARELWYSFRWMTDVKHEGRILKLFQRGHREEPHFCDELRMIGVTVYDKDPRTGEQFEFNAHGGHFGGHMDAALQGLPESPKSWHVGEFKTHNLKSYKKLLSEGVEASKPDHYAQMQVYMHLAGMKRALYLAVCKDDDRLYQTRVKYDPVFAEAQIQKAGRIIEATEPPPRLSDDPSWYECKFCDHYGVCHQGEIPWPNCRNCCHSTARLDGDARWVCESFGADLSIADQQASGAACPRHLFLPPTMPWPAVDSGHGASGLPWVQYETEPGKTIRNGPRPEAFSSSEIHAGASVVSDDPNVQALRETFNAEITNANRNQP